MRRKVGAGVDIYVFAHSLGTAVAAKALTKQTTGVSGLILMSPFNNLQDAMYDHQHCPDIVVPA